MDTSQQNDISIPKPTARPYHTLKIHQNAITCTQLISLSPNNNLLITGGDDNALAITRFSFASGSDSTSEDAAKPVTSTLIIPRAHTAAIRAVTIKSEKRDGDMLVLEIMTASNDQRVRTWHASFDVAGEGVEGLRVSRGRNLYTALADVADMDIVRGGRGNLGEGAQGDVERVVVCGVGIDVLT